MIIPLSFTPKHVPDRPPDAFERLLACHGRIRHFCSLAVKVANAGSAPPNEVADAAAALVRYFSIALPHHVLDEDESLFPQLMSVGPSDRERSAMERLADEHRTIDALLLELLPIWKSLIDSPTSVTSDAGGALRFQSLMEEHLRLEEEVLFPWARTVLSPEANQQLCAEMESRREPGQS